MDKQIEAFFTSKAFAVIGASNDRSKYGNKVLRCYLQKNKKVYPINPKETVIEGLPCLPTLKDLPPEVDSISIITPPSVTEKIVEQAIMKGIKHLWMQPGAESEAAILAAQASGLTVIAGGPCILVVLGYHE
jgi:predicted CoA-binding protein